MPKERCRDQRDIPLLDTLRQDLVYAARTLRKSPGFTWTAVATLALGIGANTAIFSVVNAVLLRPLPFKDHTRLVMIFAASDRDGPYDVASYPAFLDWSAQNRSFDALTRVRGLPGVRSAAMVADLPLNGGTDSLGFHIVGRPDPAPGKFFNAAFNVATAGYFKTMGISLLAGREFADSDRANTPGVVVINETAARKFWPGESALGKQIVLPGSSAQYDAPANMTLSVVGVTGDVRHVGLAVPPRAEIFLDSMQSSLAWPWAVLAVRAQRDAASLADTVTAAVRGTNPNVPITSVNTMEAIVARSIVEPRVYAFLLGLFATLAVGLYGLVSYTVSQRTHELGIRLALGAARGEITRLVLGQGLGLALIGTVIGVAGAAAATRTLVGLIPSVQPNDPATFGAVVLLLLTVALAATYLPARRASRVDPATALRTD